MIKAESKYISVEKINFFFANFFNFKLLLTAVNSESFYFIFPTIFAHADIWCKKTFSN